jgi:uncharacterized protein YlxW (UPF0749 family)
MNSKNFAITLVCLTLGVILAWQYKSIYNNNKMKSQQNVRLETLKDEIIIEKKKNEDLREKVDELEIQKNKYMEAMGNRGLIEENLKNELNYARIISGLTDVKGQGIVLTLDNSSFSDVSDTDLMTITNELKASEAQAISINDQRIVALSEIRNAGNYIVVNGVQITRPYVIKAIADPTKLENALNIIGGVAENFRDYLKIQYTLEKKDEILIPKVDSSFIKTNYLEIVK